MLIAQANEQFQFPLATRTGTVPRYMLIKIICRPPTIRQYLHI